MHGQRHRFRSALPRSGRWAVVAIAVALVVAVLAGPAGADADGFNDFAGDARITLAFWQQSANDFVVNPAFTTTKPGVVRSAFDTAWSSMHDQFCNQLEAGIKAGDGSWDGRNSCNPVTADHAQLRAKSLGTNLVGLRYFLPGHDGTQYSFNHKICFIVCGDANVAVSFDLTIDVVLRVAPGVGSETDSSTPLTVQSARLSFSNSWFRTTGRIGCGDPCPSAEKQLNSAALDVAGQVNLDSTNADLHTNLALLGPAYYGLTGSVDASALSLALRKDTLPVFNTGQPLATLAWTVRFGSLVIPQQGVFGVDTNGHLWRQTSSFGSWSHWFDLNTPPGTTTASGPATALGDDGVKHAFVTAANGHLYDYNGTLWVDHGLPPGTTAVGTPSAGQNGALSRVVVRGANGHIEERFQVSASVWRWVDLGNPGTAIALNPTIVVFHGYRAVLATTPNGHLAVREAFGDPWAPWRDLGAFASPATTTSSAYLNGNSISAYVTGANQQVEVATFPLFGAATLGTITPIIFQTLPAVSGAPSATLLPSGEPTIFVTDTSGNLQQFVPRHFRVFSGFGAVNSGTLLGALMRPPTVLASFGSVTAFAVATNQHVGEVHVSGTRNGLIDHTARSRVVYQAHAQDDPIVIGPGAAAASTRVGRHASAASIIGIPSWGTPVQEAQTDTSHGIFATYPDAFRVQSTQGGSVLCQAFAQNVGWLPEVNDGQTCGTTDQARHIEAIRLRVADAPNQHVIYRCNIGTWTPWVADGTACGATSFDHAVTAIQVQFSDAPLPEVTYRSQSEDGAWQPLVNDGTVTGFAGKRMEAIEVHSSVGGNLRCAAHVQDDGWKLGVDDSALCGTVGEGKRLEAFRLALAGGPPGESVMYRSFVGGLGWQPWVSNGAVTGTTGQGLQIEQVQVMFTH